MTLAVLALSIALTACNASAPRVSQSDMQAAVVAAGRDAQVTRFYEGNSWSAVWSGKNAKALEDVLAARVRHGLDHVAFMPDPGADASDAQLDVARTRAALAYAGALARGYVDPAKLHEIYTIPRPTPDLVKGLAAALEQENVAQWLEGLAPQSGDYRGLSQAYREAAEAAAKGEAPEIPVTDEVIELGDNDPRLPEITRQLVASGYLQRTEAQAALKAGDGQSGAQQPARPTYTRSVSEAIKELQRDYGIADDGIVGPETLSVLNTGPAARARAAAVAMERLRWLERNPPATRIDVNIAAAQLTFWRDGKPVDRRKAIVGKPGNETPQLQSPFFRLVANPTWTVPKSIQNGEMAGKDASYFSAHNMTMQDGWIVQGSGPDNALGMVKFDMKNDHAIYLHDTNARSLFGRSQRQLSHGCVRVHDALGFAEMIAREEGIAGQWQEARASGEEQFVSLPEPIIVRLLYHSAFINQDGAMQVVTDPYGWNNAISQKLGLGTSGNGAFRSAADDIGP